MSLVSVAVPVPSLPLLTYRVPDSLRVPAKGARVGLLYWLGRAQEEQGKGPDALGSYNRVFAEDINFQDVNQRVQALSRAGAQR